nr:MAG TPA: hypothetical protein [Caudoviricetes sp.]
MLICCMDLLPIALHTMPVKHIVMHWQPAWVSNSLSAVQESLK